ncbi:hypothetical protein DL98DRAFT_466452 [Cadophora sp. DSE1049]|nr:hypothetical protein DL98DRAFT_466452 [Cadophora sp. DSE1049]
MAPNSRPPLTSRIRASFEVRSPTAIDSEVDSPLHTNGFITQDPDSIRHAVDQAINGEAFQTAIAANLAKLIKPSIKSALDTIQPVVEAVYAHEMLLRKTNQSVEDVLSRMDTNAETAAAARRESFIDSTYVAPGTPADGEKSADAVEGAVKSREIGGPDFGQFKQLMEEHNAKTLATISESIESNTTKIAELAQGVSDLSASVGPTKESIESLKSASEQANTTSSVLQAQLDQLKLDIGQIIEAIGADLGKNIQAISEKSGAPDADLLSSHTTKLDLISTDLAALKGHADTVEKIDTISSELGALKASVEAGNTSNAEGFTSVLAAVGEHTTVLGEIKEKAPHPDILAALQQSNDSHALHATTLSEIREQSLGSAPAPVVSEGGSVDHSSALEQIQTDLTALKENIAAGLTTNNDLGAKIDTVLTTIEEHKAGDPGVEILAAVKQSNDSHAAHAAALEGLKSNSADVNPDAGLETQIIDLVAKLDSHSAVLEEIKANTGSHSSVLDEIKLASTTHADALEGIKSPGIPAAPAVDPMNLAALEIQIGSIISTLETHSAAWNEIKARNDPPSTAVIPTDTGSETGTPEGPFATIIETLMLHTSLLNEIKEDVAAEILTALHDMGQTQANQTNLLTEIREADLDDEILTLLHASSESHASHTSALDKIHAAVLVSNESHTAHATSLDEIKSRSVESAAQGGESSDLGDLKAKISSIAEKLEEYSATLSAIKDATAASNDSHAAHATSLDEIKSRSVEAIPADAPESNELSALETQITSILSTLESQTATLSAIKEGTATANPEILAAIQQSHDLLTSHGPLLESIKEGTSHVDILNNISELKSILEDSIADVASHGDLVKDLHAETKDSHLNLASAIGALALGGAAGAGATALLTKDDEPDSAVLDEVKAVRALIETSAANIGDTKEKVTTLATQIEINHTTITTSISTLSDEIKAEIDASGTGIVESITTLDGDVKAIDISPLSTSLEQHSAEIKSLSSQLDTLDGNIKENSTHITTLHSGVHLNDTGIDQLKDHVVSRSVPSTSGEDAKPMPMTEGAWFGSARSGSRSPTLSRVVSRSAVEPVPEVEEEQAKEADAGEDLPKAEEVVEADLPSEDSPAVDVPAFEAEAVPESDEEIPEGVLSPIAEEETSVESEASIEEPPVPTEISDDLPKTEEVDEAELSTETPAIADAPVDEPEPVSEVVDEVQHSTEDTVLETEPEVEDPADTMEIEVNDDLAKDEDVVESVSLPEDQAVVADADPIPSEAVEIDTSNEPQPAEYVAVDNGPEPLPAEEAVEADPTPIADEVKAVDNLEPEAAVESAHDTPNSQFQKGKAIASPGPLSPDLGSPAEFGFSREETETEPESALASPTSPVFSEGGTMVEKSGGGGGKKKKGKKEKKEKGAGGKKGKKEKVPFEMEGEDAE